EVPRERPVHQDLMRRVPSLRVKSLIADPIDGSQIVNGKPMTIRGAAWSGDSGPVTDVEVSVDGGRSWNRATMRRDQRSEFGWRLWEFRWSPSRAAYHTILARARDAAG